MSFSHSNDITEETFKEAFRPPNLPGEDTLTRALSYPYERPNESFIYRNGKTNKLPTNFKINKMYTPFIVVGSNASPLQLQRKYGGSEYSNMDVEIPVLKVKLYHLDIVYTHTITFYGSMPSTIIESEGTIIETHVILLDNDLVNLMNSTEDSYHICKFQKGCKQKVEFYDAVDININDIFVYVSKLRNFKLNGSPVAVTDFMAVHRKFTHMKEKDILKEMMKSLHVDETEISLQDWVVKLVESKDYLSSLLRDFKFAGDISQCFQIVQTTNTTTKT